MKATILPLWLKYAHSGKTDGKNVAFSITDLSKHLSPNNTRFDKQYTLEIDGLVDLKKTIYLFENDGWRNGRKQPLPGIFNVPGFGMLNATPDILTMEFSANEQGQSISCEFIIANNLNLNDLNDLTLTMQLLETTHHGGKTYFSVKMSFKALVGRFADSIYDFDYSRLQSDLLASVLMSPPSPQLLPILVAEGADINGRVSGDDSVVLLMFVLGAVHVNGEKVINEEAAITIIDLEADIKDKSGSKRDKYPLIYAIQSGMTNVVKRLLEFGADPNYKDSRGVNPLYLAAEKDNYDACLALIYSGANVNEPSYQGRLPIEAAKMNNNEKLVVLLSEPNKAILQSRLSINGTEGNKKVEKKEVPHKTKGHINEGINIEKGSDEEITKQKFMNEAEITEEQFETLPHELIPFLKMTKDGKKIQKLHKDCPLEVIIIPDSVEEIGREAFASRKNIKYVYTSSVVKIEEYGFKRCSSLINFCASKGSVLRVGSHAFEDCVNLTHFYPFDCKFELRGTFRNTGFTELEFSGEEVIWRMFSNCKKLNSVKLLNTILIDAGSFLGCDNLKSISVPQTVRYFVEDSLPKKATNLGIYVEGSNEIRSWNSNWNSNKYPVSYNSVDFEGELKEYQNTILEDDNYDYVVPVLRNLEKKYANGTRTMEDTYELSRIFKAYGNLNVYILYITKIDFAYRGDKYLNSHFRNFIKNNESIPERDKNDFISLITTVTDKQAFAKGVYFIHHVAFYADEGILEYLLRNGDNPRRLTSGGLSVKDIINKSTYNKEEKLEVLNRYL